MLVSQFFKDRRAERFARSWPQFEGHQYHENRQYPKHAVSHIDNTRISVFRSESFFQALAATERYKTCVRSTDRRGRFRGFHPSRARGGGRCSRAVRACWTVALLGLRVVGRLRGHNGPSVAPLIAMGYWGKPLKVFPSSDSQFLNVNLNRIKVRANHRHADGQIGGRTSRACRRQSPARSPCWRAR